MKEGARVHRSYGSYAPSTYGSYEPRRANPSTARGAGARLMLALPEPTGESRDGTRGLHVLITKP
jgi:hypothetical protein